MAAAKMQTGQGGNLTGDGGTTALDSRGHAEYSTGVHEIQAPDVSGLDMAELAAASVITIPPSSNGTGPHDEEAGPAAKFQPMHANQIRDLPPVAWLIKNEIPKHGQTLLWGATGSGKSFVALDYALRLSPTTPVVYVAAEGAAGYAARLSAWQKHNPGRDLGQLYFVDRAVNLLNPSEVDAFISAIVGLSPALVIFDTLARCMIGGDENTARDMGQAIESSDNVKRALGPDGGAVILVHHGTKTGTTERGSGALKGASDQVIRLDNEDGLLTLTCEKAKDAREFEPRYLRLLPVETGRRNDDGEPESSCVVVPADKVIMRGTVTKNGRKLLETLALEAFRDTGGRQATLIKASGIAEGSFARTVSALIRDGFVTQDAKGEPYRITETGQKKLSELS
ncbi:MAG: hypothetical protein BWY52_01780 [Chloroflexi bacterium ADurb.Bin325]|nr:MAG: hypothetical protein BWY52_01780 [Chloroflexi bacterium ADurb.Bin325]